MKNRKTMQNEKIQKNKEKGENNYAFIDGANLYKGVSDLGWKLEKKKKPPMETKLHKGLFRKY
ncbi:MAG: hypothetical protein UR62_C0019G0002 [Candidatus Nomurabacteria bacterium GW2011_GWF2_35_12]|uniref:NYN domain-containing protein n=2 Tax=Candidatus Nomuraibacteriota TaxID=1752729 RepID=A0A0G0GDS2_9BACT|nr:MAG: hypothetical protein UR62_C0019G0002 [Candidatus Nomurabacteria bacterium GW2011_GWF2_35_12]KKP71573.1 MAG: hypothetical protein UR70_C0023G0002 [Candidatus Nomurabacteria bacterium GW2011_GWB1_35_20]KKP77590.1 MAG: hypothetical protein UR77_C0019G0003 [Candidatus Nomurabacteria bacterium GW2011_GWC2_35_35]KKP97985.1 MAG: hypothetical protein US05_C0009G0002 [Candidatus Nomurabacteria bacterium GW2011_GWA1_36_15]HCY18066.1 hypothetical protein [Candidatus Nomurabacteria bacterium]